MLSRQDQGKLVVIVGPSGSGKDTLINWLRPRLADNRKFLFATRTVTRTADAGLEDHNTLDETDFETAARAGKFAVTWRAHGLRYGIPIEVQDHVEVGGVAIANGSRRSLNELSAVFNTMLVINLKVNRDVLARRLENRGRENKHQISKRLARVETPIPKDINPVSLDNSGNIDVAGDNLLKILETSLHVGLYAK